MMFSPVVRHIDASDVVKRRACVPTLSWRKKLTECWLSKLNTAKNRPNNGQQMGLKPYEMVEAAGVEPASADSPLLALHA